MVKLKCPKCDRPTYDAISRKQEVWCNGKYGKRTMGHTLAKMREVK